jgi:hypothetical protein
MPSLLYQVELNVEYRWTCLFANRFADVDTVLRIWDWFFLCSDYALYQISIAILKLYEIKWIDSLQHKKADDWRHMVLFDVEGVLDISEYELFGTVERVGMQEEMLRNVQAQVFES